jgi:hypothetical protein
MSAEPTRTARQVLAITRFRDLQESFEDSSLATLAWRRARSRAPAPTPAT